jgi:hypothetical protein
MVHREVREHAARRVRDVRDGQRVRLRVQAAAQIDEQRAADVDVQDQRGTPGGDAVEGGDHAGQAAVVEQDVALTDHGAAAGGLRRSGRPALDTGQRALRLLARGELDVLAELDDRRARARVEALIGRVDDVGQRRPTEAGIG